MGFESSKMTVDFPFASEAAFAAGNKIELQKNGTPPKVYEGGVNTASLALD